MSNIRKSLLAASFLAVAPESVCAASAWVPDNHALVWADGAEIAIETLDCEAVGYSGLVIEGAVTLTHPKASEAAPQRIRITCPYVVFKEGAQLRSKEVLDIKAMAQIAGPVDILSTRGTSGAPAVDNPQIWEIVKQPKAHNGAGGRNGDDAKTDLSGDWDADDGENGQNGDNGVNGPAGAIGAPGGGGKNASPLNLWVFDFADGTTVKMYAVGGNGGPGGKGGRGQDGGAGGDGGGGGKGGDGNTFHSGASGGNGGNGGDGGRGGDGGKGGDGGPGGNGADITIKIRIGGQPPADFDLSADGGYGGVPGEGGDPGQGGQGGEGGSAGCGGSGGTFLHVIHTNSGGSCGTNGHKGKRGEDGKKGPPGAFGTDGSPGNIMKLTVKYVPPSEF